MSAFFIWSDKMIHIYKSDGEWKLGNKEYTVKAVNQEDKAKFLDNGWVSSLDEIKPKTKRKAKVTKDDNKE